MNVVKKIVDGLADGAFIYKASTIALNLVLVGLGAYFIRGDNEWKAQMETRLIKDVETRIELEKFADQIRIKGSDENNWYKHINDTDKHMPKKDKDSLYVTMMQYEQDKIANVVKDFKRLDDFNQLELKTSSAVKELATNQQISMKMVRQVLDKQNASGG